MLHTSQPSAFVDTRDLSKNCKCPECTKMFVVKDGFSSLTYFKNTNTGTNCYGLVIFCSDSCALAWETPVTMYQA